MHAASLNLAECFYVAYHNALVDVSINLGQL